MILLTPELRAELPPLYSQDGNHNPTVYTKFFFPAGAWTWFVTEGEPDGDDYRFFGYVIGHENEWGYFMLSELEGLNVSGLKVERDLYFERTLFEDAVSDFR